MLFRSGWHDLLLGTASKSLSHTLSLTKPPELDEFGAKREQSERPNPKKSEEKVDVSAMASNLLTILYSKEFGAFPTEQSGKHCNLKVFDLASAPGAIARSLGQRATSKKKLHDRGAFSCCFPVICALGPD